MKPSTSLALSALLAFVSATPVEKRDPARETVTITEVDIVTVDVYGPPPSSKAVANQHANHLAFHANLKAQVAAPPPSSTPPPAAPAPSPSPAPAAQPSQPQAAPPASSSPPAAGPATGSSPEDIQNAENAKQEAVNQAQVNTNNQQKASDFAHQDSMDALQNGGGSGSGAAPAPAAPQPAAPSPAAQVPASSPQAQAPSSGGGKGGGGGGSCGSVGGSCSGDVTIYNDQGLGACGWNNDTNSEDFFALAAPMFGTYTNDSPGPHKNAFCGRTASIIVNGKTFTGTLTDRCGGCVGQSIDLSQHLFSQLYPDQPPGNGRYHDVQWSFTDEGPYDGPS